MVVGHVTVCEAKGLGAVWGGVTSEQVVSRRRRRTPHHGTCGGHPEDGPGTTDCLLSNCFRLELGPVVLSDLGFLLKVH